MRRACARIRLIAICNAAIINPAAASFELCLGCQLFSLGGDFNLESGWTYQGFDIQVLLYAFELLTVP
jgi:hypothetical protein